jgi:hypothetical protein
VNSDVQFADEPPVQPNTRYDGRHHLCDEKLHGIITVCILIFFSFCTILKTHKHQLIANVRRKEVKEKGTSQYRMAIKTIC